MLLPGPGQHTLADGAFPRGFPRFQLNTALGCCSTHSRLQRTQDSVTPQAAVTLYVPSAIATIALKGNSLRKPPSELTTPVAAEYNCLTRAMSGCGPYKECLS